jgi:hypothetical protein
MDIFLQLHLFKLLTRSPRSKCNTTLESGRAGIIIHGHAYRFEGPELAKAADFGNAAS